MSPSVSRAAIYGSGVGGIAVFVYKMLAVDYPDGDPAAARQAARVWTRLAGRIEQSPDRTFPSAEAVWKRNGGAGVQAFKAAVTPGLYPRPPAAGYADQLGRVCRQNAIACERFADIIETARHTYWTLALANLASFVFITTFPWQNALAEEITKIIMRRLQASAMKKLVDRAIAETALTMTSNAVIGSAFFAVGDVTATSLVKHFRGEDTGSFTDKLKQVGKEFTASVAFYGVSDAVDPLIAKGVTNPDLRGFLGRLAGGSLGYGPTNDALNGQSGTDLIPTWKETLGRVLLYYTMAHRTPVPAR